METRWIVLLICLSIPALLAAGTVWIQLQDRRVRSWKEAAGRIVSSKAVAREIHSKRFRTAGTSGNTDFVTDETIETRNFAEISYAFTVGANSYRGSRVNLAVDAGNFEVAETLRRYPEGKAVTVVYNPAAPQECILERDDPANIRNAWLAVAVLVGLIAAGFVAITQGADWLSGIIAKPARTPLVVVLGLFALVMAVFARMVGLEARAVKKWPTTAGRITQSEVVTTTQEHRRARSGRVRYVTMYVPRIVFTYQVDGTSFKGDNIGWSGSASTPALAEKYVKRYALQAPVEVFYNPQDPTKSTLAPGGGTIALVLWLITALLAGSAFTAGWLIK
jgi:hypothetical protein